MGADGFKEATSLRANREIAKEYRKVFSWSEGLNVEIKHQPGEERREGEEGLVEELFG